jgi:membrane protein implicated in regulation of membrane protease activity
MSDLLTLYTAHPFWVWTAVAALLLAAEVATGSGYLLWPAASAIVVAFAGLLHLGLPVEVMLFALLTLASTIAARRYLPNPFHARGPDINDTLTSLIGRVGQTVEPFNGGHGRVFVDGKEWAAELDTQAALARGAPVEVVGVKGGACLQVQAR